MSDNILESNVILKSKVATPTGDGFAKLLKGLQDVHNSAKAISDEKYKITFVVDDAGIKHANLQVIGKKIGEQIGDGVNKELNKQVDQLQAKLNRKDLKVKVTQVVAADGSTKTTVRRTQESVVAGDTITSTQSNNTSSIERTNMEERERSARRKAKAIKDTKELIDIEQGIDRAAMAKQSTYEKLYGEGGTSDAQSVNRRNAEDRRREAAVEKAREASGRRFRAMERREAVSGAERESGGKLYGENIDRLKKMGFRDIGGTEVFNGKTGRTDTVSELQRVTRTGLGQWQVETAKVTKSTGDMKVQLVEGARAARMIGDSFAKATEKVAIWLAATGAVFATIRGFQEATRVVLELEEATTLLARVSKNFGGGSFAGKLGQARIVQNEAVRFSTITGGDPVEAMRAAAVFARAGQNVKETIDSVKASMLAARIAEIGVLEAAELLSAAYLQFNMNASQVLPTLNQLNALSNNYRVTTDDLLQSISRSGSVISQQNGRLSELAAVTAVTSQVTARSGAEIGNAIKTIASNLGRADTKAMLFEKLAFTSVDAEGATKSYTRTLLEMSIALNSVSDAEKNEIGIATAGVRQRNQLLTQLGSVVEILKAENLVLMQSHGTQGQGSALEELAQTSQTLVAYLGRLRGEMVKLVTDGSGPLMDTAKTLIGILTNLISLLSSGNGLPARMIMLAAGVVIVSRALTAMQVGLKGTAAASIIASLSQWKVSHAIMGVGGQSVITTASLVNMNKALIAMAPAAASFALQMAAIATALSIVQKYNDDYAASQAILERASKGAIEETQRQVDIENDRAKAFRNTALNVAVLADELDRLNKIKNKTPLEKEQASKLKSTIVDYMGTVGINSAGMSPQEASKAAVKAYSDQIQRSIDASQNKIDVNEQQIKDAKKLRGNFKQKLMDANSFPRFAGNESIAWLLSAGYNQNSKLGRDHTGGMMWEKNRKAFADEFLKTYMGANRGDKKAMDELKLQQKDFSTTGIYGSITGDSVYKKMVDIAEAHIKAAKDIDSFNKAIEEEKKAVEALQKELQDVINKQREFAKLGVLARKINEESESKKVSDEGTSAVRAAFGEASDYQQVRAEMEKTQAKVKELMAGIDNFPSAATIDMQKILLDQQKMLREQKNAVDKIMLDSVSATTIADINGFREMQRAMLIGKSDVSNVMNHQPEMAGGLLRVMAEQAAAAANINTMSEAMNGMGGGKGSEVSSLQKREMQKQIGEQLVDLRGMEVQKAAELFRLESQITIERKKSADEAMRALGILSETDKMRVVAQAAYFAKHPDKMVTPEEEFGMRSEDVQIRRQFFGGQGTDRLDPKDGPLSRALAGIPGFGGSDALNRAAALAASARNGRTDREVIEDARARAGKLGAAAQAANGGMGIEPGYQLGKGAFDRGGQGVQPALNVNATIDFKPLIQTFSTILKEEGQEIIEEARKAFADDVRRIRSFRGNVPNAISTD